MNINKWHDPKADDDVQRQDSYESYGTSIATEPEMNEEWLPVRNVEESFEESKNDSSKDIIQRQNEGIDSPLYHL